jgi:hypothetical protein
LLVDEHTPGPEAALPRLDGEAASPAPIRTPAELVARYVALRDARQKLRDQEKALTARMEKLQGYLLMVMNKLGQDSFSAAGFTAYKTELTTVSVEDREAFMAYVRANEAFDLLEVRAGKEATLAFVEENEDLPPGVKVNMMIKVNVRQA